MFKAELKLRSNILSLIAGLVLCGVSSLTYAQDGSSGCGLGWKVAPKNSLISSTTRSYINFTFSNSSGMTSGTSGCAKHSIVQNEMKTIHFAEANQGQLMIEMAQGQGEHLRGLAELYGCVGSCSLQFAAATQKGYSQIFSSTSTTPAQMIEGVSAVIRSEPALAEQCNLSG